MAVAYSELSTERSIGGFGIGPIPVSKMRELFQRHAHDPHAENHFVAVMRHVDAETLRRAEVRARERAKGGSS